MGDEVVQVAGELQALGAAGLPDRVDSAPVEGAEIGAEADRASRADRPEEGEGDRVEA
ncbi:hypothetical protein GCM10020220_101600 [Nonomuraea rubra]|uniref:hypothetical protein n=1 Tax=Nonomuraea rubra TaxID=46180 RepID=UPI0031EF8752